MDTTRQFGYDPVGNRTDATSEPGTNRLTSVGGYTLTYDVSGKLKRKSKKNSSGTLVFDQSLVWNSLGQLESVTTNGAKVSFGYDGGSAAAQYLYTGEHIFFELDGSGNARAQYLYYPGTDRPHSVRRGNSTMSTDSVFYYLADAQGSVTGVVEAKTHELVNRYRYTPWGTLETGSYEEVKNPIHYTGREHDAETGLYYHRARYYDPQLGRFLSEDPIGLAGGINLYAYAGNNPVNFTDPDGLDCGSQSDEALQERVAEAICQTSWAETNRWE